MKTILLIFLTNFFAVFTGSTLLIKEGGWLATLSAILIILHFFVSTGLVLILVAGMQERRALEKEPKEEKQNELAGDNR